jgi:hypothetical protein
MRNLNRLLVMLIAWPWAPVFLISMGLALAGWPEHREGRTLIVIGLGHGLTVANVVALVPFSIGVAYFCLGAWHKRTQLMSVIQARQGTFELLLVQLAIGCGFLIASGPSTILRLWLAGTFLSVLALVGFAASVSYLDGP